MTTLQRLILSEDKHSLLDAHNRQPVSAKAIGAPENIMLMLGTDFDPATMMEKAYVSLERTLDTFSTWAVFESIPFGRINGDAYLAGNPVFSHSAAAYWIPVQFYKRDQLQEE